jgi:hypothetical protein
MPIPIRGLRSPFGSRASDGDASPDNRLAFIDQAALLSLRATGRSQLAQMVWVYDRAVDFDELRRFHVNLGYGLLGRQIERSPLPFGRHRWVASEGPPSDLDIAECARPRVELSDWVDERAQTPVDPEWGPGWHLGVLPMTDGSTAISLVASHCLADGIGTLLAIVDAVKGNVRDFRYPPPRSRTRLRAIASDARCTARDLPELGRTLVAAARMAFRRRHDLAPSGPSQPAVILGHGGDHNVIVPAITLNIDLDDWDGLARTLGGTSYSLLAGFAAKLGERMGRHRADDGTVTLLIAISDRTDGDTRANAVSLANVSVDPTRVTTDLSDTRVVVRQALKTLREVPDEAFELLPLTPFVPKRAVKRMGDVVLGFADLPVSSSNLGHLDPATARPDGTDAEYVMLRGVDQNVTRQDIERADGQLVLVAGRIGGKISIGIVGYQPGAENSKPRLRELVAQTLAEFNLTGVID